jgi:hypothetical protein
MRLPFEKAMTRARVVKTVLALAVIGLPTIYIFSRTGHTETALDRTLWDIGFYPVKPPSNLVGAGLDLPRDSGRQILHNHLQG